MNVVSALLALHLALLCLASVALARPSSFSPGGGGSGGNGESGGRSSEDGRSRSRNRQGRKIRLLQRVLRQLSQNEVQALLRTKKSRPRNSSYAPYFSVEPSRPQITLPEIECPKARDGSQLFSCPSPDQYGVYQCIDDHALCDRKVHCPNGEDEDRTVCMYHRVTMNNFKILMEAIFGLSRRL